MLIASRNSASENSLPYAYAVEWLESTGTQWIDMGVYLTGDDEISSEILFTSSQAQRGIWGCYIRGIWRHELIFIPNGRMECGYGAAQQYTDMSVPINTRLSLAQKKDGFYVDGIKRWSCTPTTFVQNMTAYLFHFNMASNTYTPCLARIYAFSIVRNGKALLEFKPVVDKDGVGCMYDKVSGELFYNAGSGDFAVGPAKKGSV